MRLRLLAPEDVRIGMWIEGHPGWWEVTEVRSWRKYWSISWVQVSEHPVHRHKETKEYVGQFPVGCLVMVGIKDGGAATLD